jgi:hypothetical protein
MNYELYYFFNCVCVQIPTRKFIENVSANNKLSSSLFINYKTHLFGFDFINNLFMSVIINFPDEYSATKSSTR